MVKTTKAKVGEVIQSNQFAWGYYKFDRDSQDRVSLNRDLIVVNGKTKTYFVESSQGKVQVGAYDESRGSAHFVVESAIARLIGDSPFEDFDGYICGLCTISPGDFGWEVRARRLSEQGNYDPERELISFYQSGNTSRLIPEVEIVGKMKRVFVKEGLTDFLDII